MVSESKLKKLIRKFIESPNNIVFKEIEKLLQAFGYEKAKQGGSHNVFRKNGCNPITVPDNKKPVKTVYIKEIIKILNLEDFYEK
ncbi:MAG: type II toxin-antitoxin system HicA family toxin [Candidatus Muiribacteriota bacterium]